MQKVRSRVGCLIEAPGLYGNMTAYENLNIKMQAVGNKESRLWEEILKTVGLEQVEEKDKTLFTWNETASGIGLPFSWRTGLISSDEPINGLDPGIAEVRVMDS